MKSNDGFDLSLIQVDPPAQQPCKSNGNGGFQQWVGMMDPNSAAEMFKRDAIAEDLDFIHRGWYGIESGKEEK